MQPSYARGVTGGLNDPQVFKRQAPELFQDILPVQAIQRPVFMDKQRIVGNASKVQVVGQQGHERCRNAQAQDAAAAAGAGLQQPEIGAGAGQAAGDSFDCAV